MTQITMSQLAFGNIIIRGIPPFLHWSTILQIIPYLTRLMEMDMLLNMMLIIQQLKAGLIHLSGTMVVSML